jgi:hypothetical protein
MFYRGVKCLFGVYSCAQNEKNMNFCGPHDIKVLGLLFGTLLGDSYGETRSGKSRIILQQENSNQEYLFWVHKFLSQRGYCNSVKPKTEKRIGPNNKIRFSRRVRTYSFSSLNWLIDCFYKDKIKNVPQKEYLEIYLTPLALAIWISDDGSACSSGIKIATNSFSKDDIFLLCEVLKDKYGIIAKPNKAGFSKKLHKQQYCVYIQKQSVNKVVNLVKPFIVNSMLKKIHITT